MRRREAIKYLGLFGLTGLISPNLIFKIWKDSQHCDGLVPVQIITLGMDAAWLLEHKLTSSIESIRTIYIGYQEQESDSFSNINHRVHIGKLTRIPEPGWPGWDLVGHPGRDIDVVRQAAFRNSQEIRSALGGSRANLILACLGGATPTGLAPLVARWSRKCGALTIVVVSTPFYYFEGDWEWENKVASEAISQLYRSVQFLYIHDSDKTIKIFPPKSGILTILNANFEEIAKLCRVLICELSEFWV